MPIIRAISVFDNFFSESLYKVVCSLFLTDIHQKVLVCLLHLRHFDLFRDLPNFGAVNLSEKVNELAPSLCHSCLAHA